MPRKAPAFWQENGVWPCLLSPLSALYLIGHKVKNAMAKPYVPGIPVLCIGGVVAGGSGKTPCLHAVLGLIEKNGLFHKPVILTRGYGGALKGPLLADPLRHTAAQVGDEALLHAARAITIISRDRAAGAKLAEEIGADLILMDDGLQNTQVQKSASLVVVDSLQGVGNAKLLPAGPLREPLNDALAKAALVIEVGGPVRALGDAPAPPRLNARITPCYTPSQDARYIGFAGLGHPEKFRRTLNEAGLHLAEFIAFPDHHPYRPEDIRKIKFLARQDGLIPITTEKDMVRVPVEERGSIETLPIRMEFAEEDAILSLLKGLRG